MKSRKKILKVWNDRMLQLMAYCVKEDQFDSDAQFCLAIGFPKNNISHVKAGTQSFTLGHITKACTLTGANANWLLGLETNMMRREQKDSFTKLKEATMELEILLKSTKKGNVAKDRQKK